MKLQLKRSNVLDGGSAKEPTAAQVEYGELCVNYNTSDPALFIKDSNDVIIRIAGAGAVGEGETPSGPILPDTGNKPGDVFFNETNNTLYYWNGSDWVPIASQENAADIFVGTFDEVDAAIAVDDRANGLLLWETTEGQLYIWYIDADTKQWVQAVPASGGGGGGSSVSVLPNAPSVATQGDLWYCTSDGRLYVYYDDNATSQWVDASPDDIAPVVHSGEIWPSTATEDDLFFNTTDGRLYIYYNDGDSLQWVDASPDTQNYENHWVREGTTVKPAEDGDDVDVSTGNLIASTATFTDQVEVDGDIIREWRPFRGRTSYNDYQGALFVNRPSSDWSFVDGSVRHLTAGTGYLTLGSGYVIPAGYTETITYTTSVTNGAFRFRLQTSTDRIAWTTVQEISTGDNHNSYTFSGVTEPLALRFVLANTNGTTTTMRLENLVIPNLTQKRLTDEVAGGGGIVESSDWVTTMGANQHRYIKFADGTLICTLKNIGQLDGPGGTTWTFPHAFIDEPAVSLPGARGITSGTGEGNCVLVPASNSNVTTTYVSYTKYVLSGYANNFRYYGITAIGRWK